MAMSEAAERYTRLKQETYATDTAVALLVLAETMNKLFSPDKFGDVLFDGISRAVREPMQAVADALMVIRDTYDPAP